MKNIIRQISDTFIQEAKSSPRMLEDLAAMEKYMSESYDGRTFIELLQNADDANSSRIKVFLAGKTLIVANDGRPFSENDIMAICRSGASGKKRGNNIGYRGVGFKSATTISTEIVIYSAGEFFTFSKTVCAEILGKSANKVPTVRIPFLYDGDSLDKEILDSIGVCESEEYTTFFIFKNGKIHKFLAELEEFNAGCLLFLRNISRVDIDCGPYKFKYEIKRKALSDTECQINIIDAEEDWYIVTQNNVSVAFKYDPLKGIIPCEPDEAVFHCFLPTIDKTGFLFKINADFSTDPSRKHIIKDESTASVLNSFQMLYVNFINRVMKEGDKKLFLAVSLLNTHTLLNAIVNELESGLLFHLRARAWVPLNSEQFAKPENVKIFPKWMEISEKKIITSKIPAISMGMVKTEILREVDKIELLLSKLGAHEIPNIELANIMFEADNIRQLPPDFLGKIFVYGNRAMLSNKEWMDHIIVPLKDNVVLLSDTSSENELDEKFLYTLKQLLTKKEIDSLARLYSVFQILQRSKKSTSLRSLKKLEANTSIMAKSAALAINKWKTPVQNCMTIETLRGNMPKDVREKCDDYNVTSTSKDGKVSYITVKTVRQLGESFKMSESEYAAAQRLGDNYLVYIFTTDTNEIEYTVIQNPIDSIHTEKIVKEWEWICDSYQVKNLNENKNKKIIDEKVLRSIDKTYFNTEQKNFLLQYLNDEIKLSDKKYGLLIEKINFVFDFYMGEFFFENKSGAIVVNEGKREALRKILQ